MARPPTPDRASAHIVRILFHGVVVVLVRGKADSLASSREGLRARARNDLNLSVAPEAGL